MSRNCATHPSYHSATRMKKTTHVTRISIQSLDQFWDIDSMCLKIDTLVSVGLDIAVESASGSLLISCTGDYSMRRRLYSRVEEPMDHCMLDDLIVEFHVDLYRSSSSCVAI